MRRWSWMVSIFLILGVTARAGGEAPSASQTPAVQLQEVSVESKEEGLQVTLKTVGPPSYTHRIIDTPPRLVIDFQNARYSWLKEPLTVDQGPLRQLRGSQFRKDVARLVLELTRPAPYQIRESPDGLVVLFAPTESAASTPSIVTPPAISRVPSVTEGKPVSEKTAQRGAPQEASASAPPPAAPEKSVAAPADPGPPIVAARNVEPAPPELSTPKAEEKSVQELPPPIVVAQKVEPSRPAPPRLVAQAPATPAPQPTAPQSNGRRLISLDFKDADVQNILRILAAESGKNIVAGEDVKGKLTISLRNVPWELALETVLESQGLQKLEKDNVLRIVSTERLIKEQEAKAKADETKIKSESESRTKKAEAELKEIEALTKRQAAVLAAEEAKARGPLREETIRLAYADAEETTKTLIGILGLPESGTQAPQAPTPGSLGAAPPFSALFGPPGTPQPPPVPVSEVLAKGITIRAHKPTNSIFIRHYEADVERIKKLVKEKLDIQLPQVQIEARMEIVDRTALEQLGIQWGGALAAKGDSTALLATGSSALTGTGTQAVDVNSKNPNFLPSTNTALPINPTTGLPTGGNLINLPVSLLATSANPAAGLIFGLVGNRFNINLALQALETQGKTKTLAQPQIVTVENAKATMSLGEEIPYATVSSAGTQIQFKEALLKLEVTPSVILENGVTKVKMKIVVENNARGKTVDLGSSAGNPPAIAKRKAETEVLVREGDRLVIGGVINETDTTQIRQVPFLGNIPGLGWLFKSREINNTGSELIVIITPTVLKSKG